MTVRVLIFDDHTLSRKGLRALLQGNADFEIVGDSGEMATALVNETRPDVVVLDVSPDGTLHVSAVRDVHRATRRAPVIALSSVADEHHVAQALEHGAAGYVCKHDPPEELVAAIRAVAEGRIYVTPRISHGESGEARTRTGEPLRTLTAREREIFSRVIAGETSAQIAGALGVSPRTVETHRSHLMRKLGVHTAAALVRFAAHRGLLPS